MNDLMTTSATVTCMTLKEITDLLDVRHDKAMLKVAEMAKAPEFGWMSKMDIQYSSGKGRIETIQTYQLDKRQSIAVAAHLNTALLMRIVDRWQELESAKPTQHALDLYASQLIIDGILPGMVTWWGEYLVDGDTSESMDELGYSYRKFCYKHGLYPMKQSWGENFIYKKKDFLKSLRIVSGVVQLSDLKKTSRKELVSLHRGHITNTLRLTA